MKAKPITRTFHIPTLTAILTEMQTKVVSPYPSKTLKVCPSNSPQSSLKTELSTILIIKERVKKRLAQLRSRRGGQEYFLRGTQGSFWDPHMFCHMTNIYSDVIHSRLESAQLRAVLKSTVEFHFRVFYFRYWHFSIRDSYPFS